MKTRKPSTRNWTRSSNLLHTGIIFSFLEISTPELVKIHLHGPKSLATIHTEMKILTGLSYCKPVHSMNWASQNSLFQQADKYKTTSQHPRSKHWHMLDYIITCQRDVKEVHITRAMRGSTCWSDHRLLRSSVTLDLCAPCRHHTLKRKRLDMSKLKEASCSHSHMLQDLLATRLQEAKDEQASSNEKWSLLKSKIQQTATEVQGFVTRKH